MDKGPWHVSEHRGRYAVVSEDFTHDVMLSISGDFESSKERHDYADWLATVLNQVTKESNGDG